MDKTILENKEQKFQRTDKVHKCKCDYDSIMKYAKDHNITYNQAYQACKCK